MPPSRWPKAWPAARARSLAHDGAGPRTRDVQVDLRERNGHAGPGPERDGARIAQLANHIIRTYPDLYKYFAGREFTWNKIKQQNRNPLLTMDIGADGLKTGNIGECGFGLVGSAVQNGQRLVVVVNGSKTAKERAEEARRILNWGFRSFEVKEVFPAGAAIGEAKVFGGEPGLREPRRQGAGAHPHSARQQ